MGIPQIIWLVINILGLGIHLAKHGEPRDGKYNFFVALFVVAIDIILLKFGGFF